MSRSTPRRCVCQPPDFPHVDRPAHLRSMEIDPRIAGFALLGSELLSNVLHGSSVGLWCPASARRALSRWSKMIGGEIYDSSRAVELDEHLSSALPEMRARMQLWLDGTWSSDLEALTELVCRLQMSARTLSAVVWLHNCGSTPARSDDSDSHRAMGGDNYV